MQWNEDFTAEERIVDRRLHRPNVRVLRGFCEASILGKGDGSRTDETATPFEEVGGKRGPSEGVGPDMKRVHSRETVGFSTDQDPATGHTTQAGQKRR